MTVDSALYLRLTQYGTESGGPGMGEQADPAHILPWGASGWTVSNGGKTYPAAQAPGLSFLTVLA